MSLRTPISFRKTPVIEGIGFSLAYGFLFLNIWKHRFFENDDAYISLRYARNLAEHGQLVWNLGEYHEGYTNFLYILLTSALMIVCVEDI